ncbi:MAG: PEP-CTERM sorting domain-containing protein [Candidatus Competibacteraceae bacterium]|nr:PEP-CTERM sorting domain-containing protein [Candidatus Competibacteraceae bacterium]
MAKVSMTAFGHAGTFYIPFPGSVFHAEFQAIMNPQIETNPSSRIHYHNEWVLTVNLYSLTFSPEMEASVPEPGSYALVGLGLIIIAGRRWQVGKVVGKTQPI